MKKGKTKSGFNFTVSEEYLDDIEVLELLKRLDKNDLTVLPETTEAILGPKQKERLYDHLRKIDGKVKISAVSRELGEIFAASKAIKKS